ncbi:chromatin modification- protein VID21, partial [Coemansia brasiliensis]
MNQSLVGGEQQKLEQQQEELLREYYLWANASEKDIARGLEANVDIFNSAHIAGEGLEEFMAEYAQHPQETLEATRQHGQQRWAASVPTIESGSHLHNGSADRMELESDDEERDVEHLVHPDNIVFQSQLEPIPVAQVTNKHTVKDASVLEPTMATYNYQDQIDELNTKSINMYSWMLHAQEQPLYELIDGPSKMLSTKDWETVRDELVWVRAMERIEELKEQGKWSFWQPRRHRAPPRSKAHWDHVLAEMQWMHEDFTEERKLKRAMANMVASWIMDYHHAFDKSRYTVSGHKRLLPEHFVSKIPSPTSEISPKDEETEAKPEREPDSPVQTEDSKDKSNSDMEVENSAVTDDTASVPASAPGGASERDSSETPLETIVKTEAGSEAQSLANDTSIPGANSDSVGDHIVPSNGDIYDGTGLSIYHLLSQLRDTQGMGEILGDGLYALQSFSKLMPYAPAWDEPYCNILDASP